MSSSPPPHRRRRLNSSGVLEISRDEKSDPLLHVSPASRDHSTWSDEALDYRRNALNDEIPLLRQRLLSMEQEREEINRIQTKRSTEKVLQDDQLLQGILQFVPDTYRYTAIVSKHFHRNYMAVHQGVQQTSYSSAADTVETTKTLRTYATVLLRMADCQF